MQDTVDQARGEVPRTLADIIEDARRAVWPLLRRQLSIGVLILRHRSGGGPPVHHRVVRAV